MYASKPEWKCKTEEIGHSEKQYPRNTLYDSRSKTFKTVRRKIFKDRNGVLKETIDIETGVKRTIFGEIPNFALPKDWTLEELTDSNESVNSADSIDITLLSDHSEAPSSKKNASRNSSCKNASHSSSPKENQLNESSILRDSRLSPSEKTIGDERTSKIDSDDAEDLHALSSENLVEKNSNEFDHSKEPCIPSPKNNSSSKNASRSSSPNDNQINESSILRDSRLPPSEKTLGDEEISKMYSDDAEHLHSLLSKNVAEEESNESDHSKEPRAPSSSKSASRSSSPNDNQLNESSTLRDSRLSSENVAEEKSNESDNSSPEKTRDPVGTKTWKCDENDNSGETGKSEIGDVDKTMKAVKKVVEDLFGKHKTMEDRVNKVVEDLYEKYSMRFHSRREDRHVAFNDPSFHQDVDESIQQNFMPFNYHQYVGQCVHTEFDWVLSTDESLGQCLDQESDSRLSATLPIRYGTRGERNDSQNIDDQLIQLLQLTEVPSIRCHLNERHPSFTAQMSLR